MKWLQTLRNWWNGLDEEAQEQVQPEGVSRRSFLKLMGVTTTSVYFGGRATNALWQPEPNRLVTPTLVTDVDEIRALNTALFERLCSPATAEQREAIDAVNDFTRMKMREDGYYRKILPPIQLSNFDLSVRSEAKPLNRRERRAGKQPNIRVTADLNYMAVRPTSQRLSGYIMG